MPSKKNDETEQTNPARSNPVDLQPYPIILALTPLQWNLLYDLLQVHYSGMGAEHDIIKEVQRALVSNGLLKEGS